MNTLVTRQSVQRANVRLIAEGRNPGSSGSHSLERARQLLRTHSRVSVAQAGRLAMQSLYGSAR